MVKMVIFHSKLAHLYKDGDFPGFSMDFWVISMGIYQPKWGLVICYSLLLNMAHRKFVDLPKLKMVIYRIVFICKRLPEGNKWGF
jgi:hypothetical protein